MRLMGRVVESKMGKLCAEHAVWKASAWMGERIQDQHVARAVQSICQPMEGVSIAKLSRLVEFVGDRHLLL